MNFNFKNIYDFKDIEEEEKPLINQDLLNTYGFKFLDTNSTLFNNILNWAIMNTCDYKNILFVIARNILNNKDKYSEYIKIEWEL